MGQQQAPKHQGEKALENPKHVYLFSKRKMTTFTKMMHNAHKQEIL